MRCSVLPCTFMYKRCTVSKKIDRKDVRRQQKEKCTAGGAKRKGRAAKDVPNQVYATMYDDRRRCTRAVRKVYRRAQCKDREQVQVRRARAFPPLSMSKIKEEAFPPSSRCTRGRRAKDLPRVYAFAKMRRRCLVQVFCRRAPRCTPSLYKRIRCTEGSTSKKCTRAKARKR